MAGDPRLTIDLDAVAENTRLLAARLLGDGFALVGVTKCVDGEPLVGQAMLEAGCAGLADSRLPSLVRLAAHALAPLTLIRAPQPASSRRRPRWPTASPVGRRRPPPANWAVTPRGADRPAAHGRPGRSPRRRPAGRRRRSPAASPAARARAGPASRQLRLPVRASCRAGSCSGEAEDVLGAGRRRRRSGRPLLSRSAARASCSTSTATRRASHRDPLRRRPALRLRLRERPQRSTGLERVDPILSASCSSAFFKPPAPAGPPARRVRARARGRLPGHDAWHALLDLGRRDCEPQGPAPAAAGRLPRRGDQRRERPHHAAAAAARR
jgi:hypothetical protein